MAWLTQIYSAKITQLFMAFTIALIAVYFASVALIKTEQHRFSSRLLNQMDLLISDSKMTLNRLSRNTDAVCEANYLFYLRQMMFQAKYIKDIEYLDEGRIVCSAGTGVLDYEAFVESVDFTTLDGFSVTANSNLSLFYFDYAAFRISKGRFSVINELNEIITDSDTPFLWKMFYLTNAQEFYILGDKDLLSQNNGFSLNPNIIEKTRCNAEQTICVLNRAKLTSFIDVQIGLLAFSIWLMLSALLLLILARFKAQLFSLEYRIKRGMRSSKFYPIYQPIVCVKTKEVIGCEVLARFKDNQGAIYPDEFIPIIARLGLSIGFTEKIIEQAISELEQTTSIPEGFKVNVNLFPQDLSQTNIDKFIAKTENVKSLKICFEITEDEGIESQNAIDTINYIREQNYCVAIDDFGTGYANLGQLQKFTFDYLKIDRSFVMAIAENNVKSTLIPSIIELAKTLNAAIVAEGVETPEQHQVLADYKVELAQGWLFGKPTNVNELARLIKS